MRPPRLAIALALAGPALLAPGTASAAPECFGQEATIVGTPGNDPDINGTSGADVIVGRGGDDNIEGLGGNDRICGGPSSTPADPLGFPESLSGGSGDDRISGGDGRDGIGGGPDDDVIHGDGDRDFAGWVDAPGTVIVDLAAGTAAGALGADEVEGIEAMSGSAFPDELSGDGANNSILGFAGDDLIRGRGGADLLRGWIDADTLKGGGGEDRLWGGWNGEDDDDDLLGGGGDDEIRPDFDADIAPNLWGTGNDEIDGGAGRDVLDLTLIQPSVAVDLTAGTLTGQGSDGVAGIEDVKSGNGDDDLAGDDEANLLLGGEGFDVIAGLGGNDEIDLIPEGSNETPGGTGSGGQGADRIVDGGGFGGPGRDVLIGTDAGEPFGGGGGSDVIKAKGGHDTIESSSDPAVSAGADRISAGAGLDTVYAARGSDRIKAGEDFDSLQYGGLVPAAVVVDLAAGTTTGAVDQVHSDFEGVYATAHDDVLRGTEGPNELRGLTGDDDLFGRGGDDTLLGFFGADDMFGGEGDDDCDYFASEGDTFDSCDAF